MAELRYGRRELDKRVIRRSVIEVPPVPTGRNPVPTYDNNSSLFWFVGQFADEIHPWGRQWKIRDGQLRNFITQEQIFASALGIICSRNSSFSWTLDGPTRVTSLLQDRFENSNMGSGWHDLIVKTTIDLSTQDNGAFWEVERENDSPDGTFLSANHLDAARCWHTGNPEAPVIYMDRFGHHHLLRWWQVIEFAEMPAAIEGLYGLQYCALTRMLRIAQVQRNMNVLDYEKSSGRNNRSIHLIKGITTQQMQDALNEAKGTADSMGYTRYMAPVIVGTLDPKADVGHDTIDLVGPPTDYNPEVWFKQYIAILAMAFESDYQEFAPLPGQSLGSGAQSEILHLKARGKGPGTFMKMISHAINFKILPKNVKFVFDEQDLEAEKGDAEVRAIRAQTRAVRIASGELTPEVARQIANDQGDLEYEYLQIMQEQDQTPDHPINSDSSAESQMPPNVKPGVPAPKTAPSTALVSGPGKAPNTAGRPAGIPSIRPPTPLSPKLPPNSFPGGRKEIEDEEIPEENHEVEDSLAFVRERVKELIDDLAVARDTRQSKKIIERDSKGLIVSVTEQLVDGTKPYSGADDEKLPPNVKKMPEKKRRQWVHVFNSVYQNNGDEGRAFASANAVAK